MSIPKRLRERDTLTHARFVGQFVSGLEICQVIGIPAITFVTDISHYSFSVNRLRCHSFDNYFCSAMQQRMVRGSRCSD
jgi:hypothetical protein